MVTLRMRPSEQRGVALITVMLVFVLVAIIATQMLRRSQLNLRSVGNLIETRQAYYYALGGEAYARQLLAQDVIKGPNEVDTLMEDWAQAKDQQAFEIDNGSMKIEINDLQGRFNLNGVTGSEGLGQFKKLLTVLGLNPIYANEWKDWIDSDQAKEGGNGAEDADYEGYLTPTRPEADISALRLLHSMQPQDYAKLAPHVAVLPSSAEGAENVTPKININTADVEVLQIITSSPTLAGQMIAKQKAGGYRSVEEVGLDTNVATVNSSYFEIVVTVNYADRWQRVRSVVQRVNTSGQVKMVVLSRVRSPLIDDLESSSNDD